MDIAPIREKNIFPVTIPHESDIVLENLKLDLYCAGLVLVEFDQSGTNAAATNTSISTNLDFSHNNISSSNFGSSVIFCKNIIRGITDPRVQIQPSSHNLANI